MWTMNSFLFCFTICFGALVIFILLYTVVLLNKRQFKYFKCILDQEQGINLRLHSTLLLIKNKIQEEIAFDPTNLKTEEKEEEEDRLTRSDADEAYIDQMRK